MAETNADVVKEYRFKLDPQDTVNAAMTIILITLVVWFSSFVYGKQNVDYYYLGGGSTRHMEQTCVYSHWTWHPDEPVFCTSKASEAINLAGQANAQLTMHHQ